MSLVNLSSPVQHPPFQQLLLLILIDGIWITFPNSLTFRFSFPVETSFSFERTLLLYLGQFIEWTLPFHFPFDHSQQETSSLSDFQSELRRVEGGGGDTGDQRRTTQSANGQRETFMKREKALHNSVPFISRGGILCWLAYAQSSSIPLQPFYWSSSFPFSPSFPHGEHLFSSLFRCPLSLFPL